MTHDLKLSHLFVMLFMEEGNFGMFNTLVPKVLLITLSYTPLAQQLWGLFIGWFIVQTFPPLIKIYIMGNFVYHLRGCTSIYLLLSYSFRSLEVSFCKIYDAQICVISQIFLYVGVHQNTQISNIFRGKEGGNRKIA